MMRFWLEAETTDLQNLLTAEKWTEMFTGQS